MCVSAWIEPFATQRGLNAFDTRAHVERPDTAAGQFVGEHMESRAGFANQLLEIDEHAIDFPADSKERDGVRLPERKPGLYWESIAPAQRARDLDRVADRYDH